MSLFSLLPVNSRLGVVETTFTFLLLSKWNPTSRVRFILPALPLVTGQPWLAIMEDVSHRASIAPYHGKAPGKNLALVTLSQRSLLNVTMEFVALPFIVQSYEPRMGKNGIPSSLTVK